MASPPLVDKRQRVAIQRLDGALDATPGPSYTDIVHRRAQRQQRRVEQRLAPSTQRSGAQRPAYLPSIFTLTAQRSTLQQVDQHVRRHPDPNELQHADEGEDADP